METTLQLEGSTGKSRKALEMLKRVPPSVFSILVLVVIAWFWKPHILSFNFLMLIARQSAALGIAVLGMQLVMRGGTLDLSIGGVFLLTNYLLTSGIIPRESATLQITIPILLGLIVGMINGFFIAKAKVSAVIFTLAFGTALTGIVLILSTGRLPGKMPEVVRLIGYGRVGLVPINLIVWLGLTILMAVILRFFVYGRLLSAVGDNPQAAMLSGIPVDLVVFLNHTLCGLFAGVGALIFAGYIGMGSYTEGGDIPMRAIAATILGAVGFGIGTGGVIGPFLGVWTLSLLFNMIVNLRIGEPGRLVLQGLVIFVAAVILSMRNAGESK